MLVGGAGAAGLGWLRVVIDLLCRESAAGGGFLAHVHACGGGGGGGRGLKVNWLCGLLCMSKEEKREEHKIETYSPTWQSGKHSLSDLRFQNNITCRVGAEF